MNFSLPFDIHIDSIYDSNSSRLITRREKQKKKLEIDELWGASETRTSGFAKI